MGAAQQRVAGLDLLGALRQPLVLLQRRPLQPLDPPLALRPLLAKVPGLVGLGREPLPQPRRLGACRLELLVAAPQLALGLVQVALGSGHHFDQILLLLELLGEQSLDGSPVLPVLVAKPPPGVGQLAVQLLGLLPRPLHLDIPGVDPLIDARHLALADLPDLGQPGQLGLAPLEVLAQQREPPLRRGQQVAARRWPAALGLGDERVAAVGDRLEYPVGEEPILLGEQLAPGPAWDRGRAGGAWRRRSGPGLAGERRRCGLARLLSRGRDLEQVRVVVGQFGRLRRVQQPARHGGEGGGVERHGQVAVGRPRGAGVLGERLGGGVRAVEDHRQPGHRLVVAELGADRETGEVRELGAHHHQLGPSRRDLQLRLGGAPRHRAGPAGVAYHGGQGEGEGGVGFDDEHARRGHGSGQPTSGPRRLATAPARHRPRASRPR